MSFLIKSKYRAKKHFWLWRPIKGRQRGISGKLVVLRYSLALTSIFIIKVHFPPNTDILTYAHDKKITYNEENHLMRGKKSDLGRWYKNRRKLLCLYYFLILWTIMIIHGQLNKFTDNFSLSMDNCPRKLQDPKVIR